jgi:predicted nucleic acid-binding protein
VSRPLIADTGGILRALARAPSGKPSWPEFERALTSASLIVVPALVLAEVDYFLRRERAAMRTLLAEIFDPSTTYDFEPTAPADLVRGMQIDAKFASLEIGLVDGTVAAVAERRRIFRVLTTDTRDFAALRIGARWDRRLELLP